MDRWKGQILSVMCIPEESTRLFFQKITRQVVSRGPVWNWWGGCSACWMENTCLPVDRSQGRTVLGDWRGTPKQFQQQQKECQGPGRKYAELQVRFVDEKHGKLIHWRGSGRVGPWGVQDTSWAKAGKACWQEKHRQVIGSDRNLDWDNHEPHAAAIGVSLWCWGCFEISIAKIC